MHHCRYVSSAFFVLKLCYSRLYIHSCDCTNNIVSVVFILIFYCFSKCFSFDCINKILFSVIVKTKSLNVEALEILMFCFVK